MTEAAVVWFGLLLARVGAFVAVLPVPLGASVPRTVKAGLTVALAAFQLALLDPAATPAWLMRSGGLSWLAAGLALGREAVLGALLGYAMGLVLLPARVAGDYLGQEMGLTLAPLADPTAANPSAVVSQVFELLAGVLFVGLDGHHLFLAALHGVCVRVPLGGPLGPIPIGGLVAGLTAAQEWGLIVVAPVGAALFLTTVVLALMTRAAPQLNVFSIGMGLRVGVGLGATLLLMPECVGALTRALAHMAALLERLV